MLLLAEFNSRAGNILQLVCSIFVFVMVLFVTYLVTKWIGNYQHVQMKNHNMEIVETMRIMNGKCIQIVRIAGRYYAIAVSKDDVTFLTELNEDDIGQLKQQPTAANENESFQEVLKKLKLKKK